MASLQCKPFRHQNVQEPSQNFGDVMHVMLFKIVRTEDGVKTSRLLGCKFARVVEDVGTPALVDVKVALLQLLILRGHWGALTVSTNVQNS